MLFHARVSRILGKTVIFSRYSYIHIQNIITVKKSNQNIDYFEAISFMEKKVKNIFSRKENEMIWFLNHDHIYTLGSSGSEKEIRSKINIPLIKTNRGGKITYHGPGQRIVYFLIDLKKRKKDIRKFVNIIEKTVILILKEYNIEARTFSDRIGISKELSKNIIKASKSIQNK